MNFDLTDTQRMLQDTATRLIRERYSFEERNRILASPEGFSREMWALFAELGLLGIEIAEEYGGIGGDFQDLAIVLDAFGHGLVVEPFIPTVVLGAGLVSAIGTADQKDEILPKVVAGQWFMALAHGEAKSRYSLAHVETTAPRSDDGYILTGAKSVVLGGDCADVFIVSARTSGAATDPAGISLFLVERGSPGLEIRSYANVDGTRAAEVTLDGVHVRAAQLLGTEGDAYGLIEHAFDRGTAALCAEAIGVMAALNDITLDYLKTRTQFGVPIGSFQVLQHRLVDLFVAQEQAASLAILAADRANSADSADRRRAVSAAKVLAGRSGRLVGQESIQMHGGIGLTKEYNAGHYFKRLTIIDRTFGDTDYHLTRFAAL
jgi:alkylation response protein AidB-like acyl-CoA dehydrogenase